MITSERVLVQKIGDALRREGVAITPANVEAAYFAAQGKRPVTVAEVVAAVNRVCEQLLTNCPPADEGRRVVGVFLSPEGEVVKDIRTGTQAEQAQFAEPRPYFNEPRLDDAKRAELLGEVASIKKQLASPDITPGARIRLQQDLIRLERLLGKANEEDARRPAR